MLKLIGHYNPTEEYPSPVVPICRDTENGGIFAIYRDNQQVARQSVTDTSHFVSHPDRQPESLLNFEAARDVLFAFSENEVECYERANERQYLSALFETGRLRFANPFLLLSLAEEAEDGPGAVMAARACLLRLGAHTPDVAPFAREWYSNRRASSRFVETLPEEPEELLRVGAVLRIACSLDKEFLVQRLCSGFNYEQNVDAEGELIQAVVVPEDAVAMARSVSREEVDVVMPESDTWLSRAKIGGEEERSIFAASQVVVALRPETASGLEAHSMEPTSVFERVVQQPNLRWVCGRSNTPSGALYSYALAQLVRREPGELSTKARQLVRSVHTRVLRYVRNDRDALETATRTAERPADALILQRHVLSEPGRWVPARRRALVAPLSDEPLFVNHPVMCVSASARVRSAYDRFKAFLSSEATGTEIANAGMIPGYQESVAWTEVEYAAGLISRLEKPIAVCLVADVSASMAGEKLNRAREGLNQLLGGLSVHRGDAVGLISFSDEVSVLVAVGSFSQQGPLLEQAVRELAPANRTALLDAVVAASQQVREWPDHLCTVVVLTDGLENESKTSKEEAIRLLTTHQYGAQPPLVYALEYGEDADRLLLREICAATGGRSFEGNVYNIGTVCKFVAGLL